MTLISSVPLRGRDNKMSHHEKREEQTGLPMKVSMGTVIVTLDLSCVSYVYNRGVYSNEKSGPLKESTFYASFPGFNLQRSFVMHVPRQRKSPNHEFD
jgi:hypothetical protein